MAVVLVVEEETDVKRKKDAISNGQINCRMVSPQFKHLDISNYCVNETRTKKK